jgi:hypothetical protein
MRDYVSVKKNLVRAHAVALKDGGKSVVVRVEALVAPVGVDRSSRGRKSAYRRVTGVGKRENTWGERTREPNNLVLHLVEREGMTVVNVGESSLYAFWWQEASER